MQGRSSASKVADDRTFDTTSPISAHSAARSTAAPASAIFVTHPPHSLPRRKVAWTAFSRSVSRARSVR